MDVSTPPSLDSACPQANTELGKHDHRFMKWSVDNNENGQEASVFTKQAHTHSTQQIFLIELKEQVMIQSHIEVHREKHNWAMANCVLGQRTSSISNLSFKENLYKGYYQQISQASIIKDSMHHWKFPRVIFLQ